MMQGGGLHGKGSEAAGKSWFYLQPQLLALEAELGWWGWLFLCSGAGSGAAGTSEWEWGTDDVRGEQHDPGAGCYWDAHQDAGLAGTAPLGYFALCCCEHNMEGCEGFWRGEGKRQPSKQ